MTLPRRRELLATLASVGFAGCLEGGDGSTADETDQSPAQESDDPTPTPTPTPSSTPTPTPDDSTSDEPTPTPDDSTPEDEQTPTPTDEQTPAEDDESTPTPPEDDRDEEIFPDYEMTNVGVRTPEDDLLGWVRAAIADTSSLRYTGLSDTESLPESYGMLFVYDSVGKRTYVMREMDFGLDIIFADDEGRITTIHHAPEPGPDEDGSEQRYPGTGQYVLEVNRDWTTDRGVEEGDYLDIDR